MALPCSALPSSLPRDAAMAMHYTRRALAAIFDFPFRARIAMGSHRMGGLVNLPSLCNVTKDPRTFWAVGTGSAEMQAPAPATKVTLTSGERWCGDRGAETEVQWCTVHSARLGLAWVYTFEVPDGGEGEKPKRRGEERRG